MKLYKMLPFLIELLVELQRIPVFIPIFLVIIQNIELYATVDNNRSTCSIVGLSMSLLHFNQDETTFYLYIWKNIYIMWHLQNKLQRCSLDCVDLVKDKFSVNSQADSQNQAAATEMYNGCVTKCFDVEIKRFDIIKPKIEESCKQYLNQ